MIRMSSMIKKMAPKRHASSRKKVEERYDGASQDSTILVTGILQRNENCVRINTLIHFSALEIYHQIFIDPRFGAFSNEATTLYKQLKHCQDKLLSLKGHEIRDEEWETIFPQTKATVIGEFSLEVFGSIIRTCVTDFPLTSSQKDSFMNVLEDLLRIMTRNSKHLIYNKNRDFEVSWSNAIFLLTELGYNTSSVQKLKTDSLDFCDLKFRYSLIVSQLNVLSKECTDTVKSNKLNNLAMERLTRDIKHDPRGEIYALQLEIKEMSTLLEGVESEMNTLKPQALRWREKNLEGDIIVLDEKLVMLKNKIIEHSKTVASLFREKKEKTDLYRMSRVFSISEGNL